MELKMLALVSILVALKQFVKAVLGAQTNHVHAPRAIAHARTDNFQTSSTLLQTISNCILSM